MNKFSLTSSGLFLLWSLLLLPGQSRAQDFLLQGWYWDYPKTANGFLWADTLRLRTQALADAGFTYVWLPPLSRASFGSLSNGYDPKDLFDLGEFGQGPTGFGARTDVDAVISAFDGAGIRAVADVVYNHRDGGRPEDNPAVAGWIRNMTFSKIQAGDQPFPNDRFRLVLPIGGTTGRGAGTYFFKFASRSGHPNFHNKPYKVYMQTNRVGFQGQPNDWEFEPNGGGGCGQGNNVIRLGVDMFANVDALGCTIDEFALTINSGDFNAAGDSIFIFVNNRNVNGLGDYSDHTVVELYYTGAFGNIEPALVYQTYTDFTNLPSGQGAMNWPSFKPNGNPTQLAGDQDGMFFFYDYDQNVASTRSVLFDWSRWLWNDAGIRGYRLDAVKQFPANFVGDLLDNLYDNGIAPGMVVGEFFDGNTGALANWINQVYANMDNDTKTAIQPRVFDFSLRYALKAASDAFGYDARNIFNASLVDAQGVSGFNVVTFTDNHDFRDPGQPIDNDPILGYAYILTNNQVGLPSVFYKDYINRGLKPRIDALMGLHKKYIFGASQRDYLSRIGTPYTQSFNNGVITTTLLYQISGGVGGRDVVVAINYAGLPLDVTHGVNTSTMGISAGDKLTLVGGTSAGSVVEIDANGRGRFQAPPRGYAIWVRNEPPVANAGDDATVACTSPAGTGVTLNGSASSDADDDALIYTWTGPFGQATGVSPTVTLPTGGPYLITLTVSDEHGGSSTDDVLITVADNQAPVLSAISAPVSPQPLGTTIAASASFTDACGAPHTATWNWGDGSSSAGTVGAGSVSGSRTYAAPGVYLVTLTLTDAAGNAATAEFRYVVIYDPGAGFVTGGGWIDSPAGAYRPDPSLSGKANFGFVSKYKKGQSTPDGNTRFQFKAGDLNFQSTAYEWLVIAGPNAKFKGSGAINGQGDYGFLLTARDGQMNGGGGIDRFRIKIWQKDAAGTVVYDNQLGDADNADASDAIEGGSIVIHQNSNLAAALPGPDAAGRAFPNPFREQTSIAFELPAADRLTVTIYDAAGRRVRSLFSGELVAGYHLLEWDGRNDAGARLPEGLYVYEIRGAALRLTERVVMVR